MADETRYIDEFRRLMDDADSGREPTSGEKYRDKRMDAYEVDHEGSRTQSHPLGYLGDKLAQEKATGVDLGTERGYYGRLLSEILAGDHPLADDMIDTGLAIGTDDYGVNRMRARNLRRSLGGELDDPTLAAYEAEAERLRGEFPVINPESIYSGRVMRFMKENYLVDDDNAFKRSASRGWDQTQGLFGSAMEALGNALNIERLKQYGHDLSFDKQLETRLNPRNVASLERVAAIWQSDDPKVKLSDKVSALATWGIETIGEEALPLVFDAGMVMAGAATGGVTAAAVAGRRAAQFGIRKAAVRYYGKAKARKVLDRYIGTKAAAGSKTGAKTGLYGAAYPQTTGDAMQTAQELGVEDSGFASLAAGAVGAGLETATDWLLVGRVFKSVGISDDIGEGIIAKAKYLAKEIGKGGLKQAAAESPTELLQEANNILAAVGQGGDITQIAPDGDWETALAWRLGEAAAAGFVVGGASGGVASGVGSSIGMLRSGGYEQEVAGGLADNPADAPAPEQTPPVTPPANAPLAGVERNETPEPPEQVYRQLGAMADPQASRDTVFVSGSGFTDYTVPDDAEMVEFKDGSRIYTTDDDKLALAAAIAAIGQNPSNEQLQQLVGYGKNKADISQPMVIQSYDADGNVISDEVIEAADLEQQSEILKQRDNAASVRPADPVDVQQRRADSPQREQTASVETAAGQEALEETAGANLGRRKMARRLNQQPEQRNAVMAAIARLYQQVTGKPLPSIGIELDRYSANTPINDIEDEAEAGYRSDTFAALIARDSFELATHWYSQMYPDMPQPNTNREMMGLLQQMPSDEFNSFLYWLEPNLVRRGDQGVIGRFNKAKAQSRSRGIKLSVALNRLRRAISKRAVKWVRTEDNEFMVQPDRKRKYQHYRSLLREANPDRRVLAELLSTMGFRFRPEVVADMLVLPEKELAAKYDQALLHDVLRKHFVGDFKDWLDQPATYSRSSVLKAHGLLREALGRGNEQPQPDTRQPKHQNPFPWSDDIQFRSDTLTSDQLEHTPETVAELRALAKPLGIELRGSNRKIAKLFNRKPQNYVAVVSQILHAAELLARPGRNPANTLDKGSVPVYDDDGYVIGEELVSPAPLRSHAADILGLIHNPALSLSNRSLMRFRDEYDLPQIRVTRQNRQRLLEELHAVLAAEVEAERAAQDPGQTLSDSFEDQFQTTPYAVLTSYIAKLAVNWQALLQAIPMGHARLREAVLKKLAGYSLAEEKAIEVLATNNGVEREQVTDQLARLVEQTVMAMRKRNTDDYSMDGEVYLALGGRQENYSHEEPGLEFPSGQPFARTDSVLEQQVAWFHQLPDEEQLAFVEKNGEGYGKPELVALLGSEPAPSPEAGAEKALVKVKRAQSSSWFDSVEAHPDDNLDNVQRNTSRLLHFIETRLEYEVAQLARKDSHHSDSVDTAGRLALFKKKVAAKLKRGENTPRIRIDVLVREMADSLRWMHGNTRLTLDQFFLQLKASGLGKVKDETMLADTALELLAFHNIITDSDPLDSDGKRDFHTRTVHAGFKGVSQSDTGITVTMQPQQGKPETRSFSLAGAVRYAARRQSVEYGLTATDHLVNAVLDALSSLASYAFDGKTVSGLTVKGKPLGTNKLTLRNLPSQTVVMVTEDGHEVTAEALLAQVQYLEAMRGNATRSRLAATQLAGQENEHKLAIIDQLRGYIDELETLIPDAGRRQKITDFIELTVENNRDDRDAEPYQRDEIQRIGAKQVIDGLQGHARQVGNDIMNKYYLLQSMRQAFREEWALRNADSDGITSYEDRGENAPDSPNADPIIGISQGNDFQTWMEELDRLFADQQGNTARPYPHDAPGSHLSDMQRASAQTHDWISYSRRLLSRTAQAVFDQTLKAISEIAGLAQMPVVWVGRDAEVQGVVSKNVRRWRKAELADGQTTFARVYEGRLYVQLPEVTEDNVETVLLAFGHEVGHLVYLQHKGQLFENGAMKDPALAAEFAAFHSETGLDFSEFYADKMAGYLRRQAHARVRPKADADPAMESAIVRKLTGIMNRVLQGLKDLAAVLGRKTAFTANAVFDAYAEAILKKPLRIGFDDDKSFRLLGLSRGRQRRHGRQASRNSFSKLAKAVSSSVNVVKPTWNRLAAIDDRLGLGEGQRISDLFISTKDNRGYGNRLNMIIARMHGKLRPDGLAKPKAMERAYRDAVVGNDTEGARALAKWVDDVLTFLRDELEVKGLNFTELNTTPRSFDISKVMQDEARFAELLTRHNIPNPLQFAQRVVEGQGFSDLAIEANFSSPGVTTNRRNAAVFSNPELVRALVAEGFVELNGVAVMNGFMGSLSSVAAFNTTFGQQFGDLYSPTWKIRDYIRQHNLTQAEGLTIVKATKAVTGQLGIDAPVGFRRAQSWAITTASLSVLSFAGVASMPDITTPLIATHDAGIALKTIWRIVTSREDRREAMAMVKFLGQTSDAVMKATLGNLWTTDSMTKGLPGKLADIFFRLNGQHLVTNISRTVGALATKHMLLDYASRPNDPKARRHLKRYGVTPEQINRYYTLPRSQRETVGTMLENDSLSAVDRRAVIRVHHAMSEFIRTGSLMPDPTTNPIAFSDPWLAMLTTLKRFFYAIHWTVIKSTKDEIMHRVEDRQLRTATDYIRNLPYLAGPLVMVAVALLPIAAIGWELREFIKGGRAKSPFQSKDAGDYTMGVIGRAGLMGILDIGSGMYYADKFGDPFFIGLSPVTGMLYDVGGYLADAEFDRALQRMTPGSNQISWLKFAD